MRVGFYYKSIKNKNSCYNAEGISLIVVIKNDIITSVNSYKHAETWPWEQSS